MLPVLFLLFAAAPAHFDQVFRAGLIALQQDQLDVAETNLRDAARLEPSNPRVWAALAQTHWKAHAPDKAADDAEKAARYGSNDASVLQSLVVYYSESGQMLQAAAAQARLARLNPAREDALEHAADLYFQAAQALLREQKFAEAVAVLEEARDKTGKRAQTELALGVAYYGLRRFNEAAGAFLETIRLAPDAEQPYLFLSRMLDAIPARLPAVTERFVQYEAAHPDDARGYLLHAKALDAQSREPDQARQLLTKSIELNARDASAHVELATLLERARDYAGAAAEFERAAALEPNDAGTHYHLARLYDRLNRPDAAASERDLHAKLMAAQDAPR